MPEFRYVALTADGEEKKGNITSTTLDEALASLRGDGLFPTTVEKATVLNKDLELPFGSSVSARDLSVFCRQFVSMLSSGVTILAALEMQANQTENKTLARTLSVVRDDITKGETLANAMKRHPKVFPELMISMVEAGEASGKLEVTFELMADHFERVERTKGMIRKASVYPIVVAIVAVIVMIIMFVKVIPAYTDMFNDMDIEMPKITLAVVAASNFLIHYWYVIVGVIVAIVLGVKAWHSTPEGKLAHGRASLKAPLFGKLHLKSECSVMARTLSTLIYSGMDLVEALEIVAKVTGNEVIKRTLRNSAEDVRRGVPLSKSLEKAGVFPPMVIYMIGVGEETGEIEDMLSKLADYYDEEVEMTTQTVMAAIEPMIILIMAALVMILIAAVMSPMIAMYSNLGDSL